MRLRFVILSETSNAFYLLSVIYLTVLRNERLNVSIIYMYLVLRYFSGPSTTKVKLHFFLNILCLSKL